MKPPAGPKKLKKLLEKYIPREAYKIQPMIGRKEFRLREPLPFRL